MKHLAVLCAVVSISAFHASRARATSPTCTSAVVRGSAPAPDEPHPVPLDARLAFETSYGCRGAITAELFDPAGQLVSTKLSPTTGAGYFYKVVPSAPLRPATDYRLVVREGDELAGNVRFRTGSERYVKPAAGRAPLALEIRSFTYVSGPTSGSASGESFARFEIVATHVPSEHLGILHLQDTEARALPGPIVDASIFTGGRAELRIELQGRASPGRQKCYGAIYEDEVGTLSPLGAEVCITPPELPPDLRAPPSDGLDGEGCSTSGTVPHISGGFGVVLALALLAASFLRRRPWARSIEQERAELESLATGADGDDARALLVVVGTILREAAGAEGHPTTWIDGDVVIRLRRRDAGGLVVEIGRDRDGRVHALFDVTFARIPFEHVVGLIHRAPPLVAPGFVVHDGDTMEISTVRWLHPFDVLDEPTEVWERPRRTSDAVPADPSVEVEIDVEWDPDSTIVQAPTDELLASTRRRAR